VLQYDPKQARRKELTDVADARLYSCAHGWAKINLDRGFRDSHKIIERLLTSDQCATLLWLYVLKDPIAGEPLLSGATLSSHMHEIAEQALDDVLAAGR
jgi:hypothetical protein